MALRNQIAIVTGATSGIGRATALALSDQSVQIALASRSRALVHPKDVTCIDQVGGLIQSTLARWGKVDIRVVNLEGWKSI